MDSIFSTRDFWKRCLYENSLFQALENFSMKNCNYKNSNYFRWCEGSFVYFAFILCILLFSLLIVVVVSAVVCRSFPNKF